MKWLALILLFVSTTASAAYSGYTYQRSLTIDHTKVSTGTLTYSNMPILVSTTGVTLSTSVSGGHLVNSSAFDLIFSTMSDCSFLLNWDTETINATGTSAMNAWVKVPTISSSTDTTFYLCYGNSGITSYQGLSTGTWSNGYTAVWHFDEATAATRVDSTSGRLPLTATAVTASAGRLSGGATFNGTTSKLVASGTSVLGTLGTVNTSSAWVNITDFTAGTARGRIWDHGTAAFYTDNNNITNGFSIGGAAAARGSSANNSVATGSWFYTVATTDGSTARFYSNSLSTGTAAYTDTYSDTSGNFAIGNRDSDSLRGLGGVIAEVRLSSVVRSADWIKTEYNNQSSTGTFITIGAETTSSVASTNAPFMGAEF